MSPVTPNRYSVVDFAAVAVQNERIRYRCCRQPRCCAESMQCEPALIYLFIYIHRHHHHLRKVSSQMERLLRQYNLWSNEHDKYMKFIRLVRQTIQQQWIVFLSVRCCYIVCLARRINFIYLSYHETHSCICIHCKC